MADQLVENAEFGKKRKGEEDPILVAQRFLNIYRQIHIFNKERQDEFDDMLLKMPAEIRVLLSTLPGGSLLLEHIQELEEKRGLVSPNIKPDKEASNAAAGLVKQQPSQPIQNKNNQNSAGGGNVVIDASFASELSNSLSFALQQSEKRYKDDIKTLTETLTHSIMESQTAIANMMKDILLSTQLNNPQIMQKFATQNSTTTVHPAVNVQPATTIQSAAIQQPAKSVITPDDEQNTADVKLQSSTPKEAKISIDIPADTTIKVQNKPLDKTSDVAKVEEKSTKTDELKKTDVDKSITQTTFKPDIKTESAEKNVAAQAEAVSLPKENIKKDVAKDNISASRDNAVSLVQNTSPQKNVKESKQSDVKATKPDNKPDKSENITSAADLTFPINKEQMSALDKSFDLNKNHKERKKLSETDEVMPFVSDVPLGADRATTKQDSKTTENDDDFDDLIGDIGEESDSNLDSLFNELQGDNSLENKEESKPDMQNNLDKIRQALQPTGKTSVIENKQTKNQGSNTVNKGAKSFDKKAQNKQVDIKDINPDDIVSLDDIPDNPISLDDVPDTSFDFGNNATLQPTSAQTSPRSGNDDDWEWEYVDEDGNVTDAGDDDWEWEYVDEDGNVTDENNDDWEWEYVEDNTDTSNNGSK